MGNVFLCHAPNRRSSILNETPLSSEVEPGSSDEMSAPRITVIPDDNTYRQRSVIGYSPIPLSQFPSSDMAKYITGSGYNTSASSSIGNIFSNSTRTARDLTSPAGRSTWRDTETFTQHEKWLASMSPSLILPTLFLGSKKDSTKVERLKELQITHILSVMGGKQHLVSGCKHLSVPMADNGNTSLEEVMDRSFDFIEESQQDGNKILIHCHRGQNRSATVVIAWLMTKSLMNETPMSMHEAYRFVKERRDVVHPSNLYIQQLREYDKQLFGVYSVKPNFLSLSYEDGELKVEEENWSAVQSREYKKMQKNESSQRSKSRLPSKIVPNDTQSSDQTPSLEKKTTHGSFSSSVLVTMTSVKEEGVINIVYPAPLEEFESESSHD